MLQRNLTVVIQDLILVCSNLIQETSQFMYFLFVCVLAFGVRTGCWKNGAKYRIFNYKPQYTTKGQECIKSGNSAFLLTLLSALLFCPINDMHNVKTSSFLKLFAPYILQKQNYNRDTQAVPLGLEYFHNFTDKKI